MLRSPVVLTFIFIKSAQNEEWLAERLINYIDQKANDSAFIQSLTLDKDEPGDYYDWQGLKFFLASYEEYLRARNKESIDLAKFMRKRDPKHPNDFYHREHIWAVEEKRFAEKDDVNKRRLGNFILLKETQNIKMSNKPIEEKVVLYWDDRENDPNTLMIRELKVLLFDVKEDVEKRWSRQTRNFWLEVYTRFLDQHEEGLINFALKRWQVKELKHNRESIRIDSLTDKNEIYFDSNNND